MHGHKLDTDINAPNSRRIAEEHLNYLLGRRGPEIPRPFKCTADGCDKSYKNLNGFKYHMEHSHPPQEVHNLK